MEQSIETRQFFSKSTMLILQRKMIIFFIIYSIYFINCIFQIFNNLPSKYLFIKNSPEIVGFQI